MSVNKKKSLKLHRHKESDDKLDDAWVTHLDETKKESADKSSKREETPTPLHSTPKKSSAKLTQDQSDLRASPMLLPCTQDGGNEVAWDWQSPMAKSASARRRKSNGEHVGTPKRTTMLQKKRNSNSPLLYKPIKRKLMKNDNQHECFETFTAEMKALSEQIKTKDETEHRLVGLCDSKSVNVAEDELLIEIDIEDFTESATKLVATSPDVEHREKRPEISVAKTSMEDLFDDSIEDSMVKCSQEVEEKLRLESCRVEASSRTRPSGNNVLKDFSWHQQSYTSFLTSKDNSSAALVCEKTSEKMHASSSRPNDVKNERTTCRSRTIASDAARKSAPSRRTNCEAARSKSPSHKTTSKGRTVATTSTTTQHSEIFEIPDDSFDEDFLDVCFDDVEVQSVEKTTNLPNQATSRYGKFYTSPHANVSTDSGTTRKYIGTSTAARKLLPPPPPAAQSSSNDSRTRQDQFFPRSSSNGSLDGNSSGVNSTRLHQSQSAMNSSRKFFKTKSLSTSNFDDSTNIQGKTTTSSSMASMTSVVAGTSGTKSWKSNFSTKSSSVSNSTIQAQQRKTSPSAFTNNAWRRTSSERNDGIEHFNRNAPRDDGNRLKMINDSVQRHNGVKESGANNHSQSTQICTPEEIERKRREAKMKLEMKRKLQARSKSASLLSDFTTNRPPVKR